MKTRSFARGSSKLGLAALVIAGAASAADVYVMISAGFYGVYSELGPAFERASGHRRLTTRGPSMGDSPEAIPARLARGSCAGTHTSVERRDQRDTAQSRPSFR